MAEPIRKPVHRPRPPHPHTQSRPHTVLARSRLLPQELDTTPLPQETPAPPPASLTLLPRPALRKAPPRTAPLPAPPLDSGPDPLPVDLPSHRAAAALAPPEDLPLSSVSEQVRRERRARGLLLTALALHAGALLVPLAGAAADLGPAELLLAGCVLLSGGLMLVFGRR